MAQPIPFHRNQPIKQADAVSAAYALLQELHDRGVLDFLRGLTGAGGDIVTRLSAGANTPESIAALRNIVSLLRILGSIDPEILHGVANIVTKPQPPDPDAPRLLSTLKKLTGKDARRALGAAAYGLQVFGKVLISRQLNKP